MAHQDLYIGGQRIPSVTEWLDVLDKSWLRGWYAKEELKRCIVDLSEIQGQAEFEKKDLKAVLAAWRKRLKEKDYAATKIGQEAAAIGTEFHSAAEAYLKRQAHVFPPEMAEKVFPLVAEFIRFADDWKLSPTVGQEIHVVSRRYVYQGTFDFLGTNAKHEGLGLFDWKTSNKIDDTYGLQVALYAYAYGEQQGWTEAETWTRITHGGAVRVDKYTKQLEWKIYTDLPYLFRVAAALREPYDYRNKVGAWEQDSIDREN